MTDPYKTAGSLAVAEERRVLVIEAAERPQDLQLRVAAYTRVSSDSEDQLNSFTAQNRYYTALISSKENWTMVDVYADRGITGTSAEKREDFQRLLADCRRGLIDRVLCKSISRFARNTTECLEAIRELKSLGIGITFEKEHIDTAKMSGEMLTAIFAAMAQKESESISQNGRLGVQMRMKNGTFIPSALPFGYTRASDGKIVIDKTRAPYIRAIFRDYVNGHNTNEIAAKMQRLQIKESILQNYCWTHKAVARILRNEKYSGNSLWQKTYRTDTLPIKAHLNHGERPQYFAEGSHPAIIDRSTFDTVQAMLAQRKERFYSPANRDGGIPLRVQCGYCGSRFRTYQENGIPYRICRTHADKASDCPIKRIPEAKLHSAFCRLYYKLKHHSDQILVPLIADLQTIRTRRFLWSPDIIELNKQISNLTSQNQLLAMLKQQGGVDPDIFISRSNELAEQLRAVKQEKSRLLNEKGDDTIARTQELIETLDAGPDFLDAFDGELFGELVEKIIVESNELLRFRLKSGLELTEKMERTVR